MPDYNYQDKIKRRRRRNFIGTGTVVIAVLVISVLILVFLMQEKNKIKPLPAKSETPSVTDEMAAHADSAKITEPVQIAPAAPAEQPVTTSKKSDKSKPPIKKILQKDVQFKTAPAKKSPATTDDKPVAQPESALKTGSVQKSPAEPSKQPVSTTENSAKNIAAAKTINQQDPPIKIAPEVKSTPTHHGKAPADNPAKKEADASTEVAMVTQPSIIEKKPVKYFEPEDMPIPETIKLSEDTKTALLAQRPEKGLKDLSFENASDKYRKGMLAFRKKDYRYAIKFLADMPAPAKKKRGIREREEYVKANFYRGLSLQKVGSLKEAVAAYQNVLSVEKYYPVCEMNLGICYIELQQYAKAHRALQHVIRDQNRIPPIQYDQIIQRTRYFWALAWTRMFKNANQADKKEYFRQQAILKWTDYKAWFGGNSNFAEENKMAENYLNSLKARQ